LIQRLLNQHISEKNYFILKLNFTSGREWVRLGYVRSTSQEPNTVIIMYFKFSYKLKNVSFQIFPNFQIPMLIISNIIRNPLTCVRWSWSTNYRFHYFLFVDVESPARRERNVVDFGRRIRKRNFADRRHLAPRRLRRTLDPKVIFWNC